MISPMPALARRRRAGSAFRAAGRLGRYRLVGADALNTVHHDAVAVAQSARDGYHARRRRSELHAPLLRLVLTVDHIDIVAALIGQNSRARYANRFDRFGFLQYDC